MPGILPVISVAVKVVRTYTFGCKVNQVDTSMMESSLRQAGDFLPDRKAQSPDIVVVNTCTVTAEADRQARQLIRRVHREHPFAQIVVTGCYADSQPKVFDHLEGVSHVVPLSRQRDLPILLGSQSFVEEEVIVSDSSKTRAMLKMQEGCNCYCSFCILPYIRGRGRSVSLTDVCANARKLEALGHREIVITGTHLASYGRDLKPRIRFAHALEKLLAEVPKTAIRISSLEPEGLTPDLLRLIHLEKQIRPHFHIPLQSGSATVLKRMNRNQPIDRYRQQIEALASTRESVAIGADVMVGFPGESASEFQDTVNLVATLPIAYLHVFPFSSRPGTAAAQLADDVSPALKKERVGILRKLGFEKRRRFYTQFMGSIVPVLVEQKRNRDDLLMGHTPHYVPVSFSGENSLMAQEVKVRLNSVDGETPEGLRMNGERVG